MLEEGIREGTASGLAMRCTPEELAQKRRFDDAYTRSQTPVMQSIERRVCGCDYGGNSWTSRRQADELITRLGLSDGTRLLDLGAGSGWPALYLAGESGCQAVLADLPEIGLRIAAERTSAQGLAGRIAGVVADAAELPLPDGGFDAINHSDLLCCLVQKRAVLQECRRVIRSTGRMAFTVISIAPGLGTDDYARALANGPDFIETAQDYPSLLADTGWAITDRSDLTQAYAEACDRQIRADIDHAKDLADLIGKPQAEQRLAGWRAKVTAIGDGLIRRELFVATLAGD